MEIVSLIASLVSLAVSVYLLRIVKPKEEGQDFTKDETNQLRQILNVLTWMGEVHED